MWRGIVILKIRLDSTLTFSEGVGDREEALTPFRGSQGSQSLGVACHPPLNFVGGRSRLKTPLITHIMTSFIR